MFYTIYRLYSARICANGTINAYKPATRFIMTNIRSPFHNAYGGIHEGIYAKK
jgi:hypothetical protein